jgi:DNA-binding NtrC family response regulator
MNTLEKAKANTNGSQLPPSDPSQESATARDLSQVDPQFSLRSLRAEAEIYAITRTLEYTGWNRRRAAKLLSISYRGILYKIRQHNLTPGSGRPVAPLGQTLKAE